MNTYKLTLIALFASLAVVGRFAFQFLPNVQPVTTILIICGFFLGPISAIMLAVLATYLSNLLLGLGIWSIWQIIAWGIIGFISGLIGKLSLKKPFRVLICFGIISGYFYGLIVSLATYSIAGKFTPYYLAGLPFDTYHALGNGFFMVMLFPVMSRIFHDYQKHL